MIGGSSSEPGVLAWRPRAGEDAGPAALARRLAARGWVPAADEVVVTVGQTWRSPAVVEVAGALVRALAEGGRRRVLVVDAQAGAGEWDGATLVTAAREDAVQLAGIAVPGALVVPRRWFTPHAAVLVCGVGPSPAGRLAGVLDAEAETLSALGNDAAPEALVFEAHRLAAPDLAVVAGRDDAGLWAVASPSDVAAESAVARAAGLEATDLPALRAVARHELLGSPGALDGRLPRLHGLAAPAWRARLAGLAWRVRAGAGRVLQDARMFRRNVRKIPGFIRRRLASRGAA
jgi:hypothetical protein